MIWVVALAATGIETGQSQDLPQAAVVKTSKAPGEIWGSKTFELKYVDAEEIRQFFSGRANVIQTDERFNVLTATGPTGFLSEVEATIQRFDVPPAIPQNVQMTFYVIAPAGQVTGGVKLPPELAGMESQLGLPGGASGLRVADTQVVRVRAGEAAEAVGLTAGADGFPTISQIRFRWASVGSRNGKSVVSVEGLQVQFNVPGLRPEAGKPGSRIAADLDLPAQQGVVLTRGGADKPYVLLVRAEISG